MSVRHSSHDAPVPEPAYLVFDVETVPDGQLLNRVRYPHEEWTEHEAVERARAEALERSEGRSDYVATSFNFPVAVCVARVSPDFSLQSITCLDTPQFRPAKLVEDFWKGLGHFQSVLVSYGGRSFDLPVLELAAFRFGVTARGHFTSDRYSRRHRYGSGHLDLADWLGNHGACPIVGGLDLLSKMLGNPGDRTKTGKDIWELYKSNQLDQINHGCMFNVLDTYFVFLRTRVMTGDLTLHNEQQLVEKARDWISQQSEQYPHLSTYLEHWGTWTIWL